MGREGLHIGSPTCASHGRSLHRRGYALILAVMLLVLMALVGIAFLTTTRNDRYASHQHTASAQADLLLDGVVTLVETALVDDLFDGTTDAAAFRRPGMTYEHVDGEELFLADRVPAWIDGDLPLADDHRADRRRAVRCAGRGQRRSSAERISRADVDHGQRPRACPRSTSAQAAASSAPPTPTATASPTRGSGRARRARGDGLRWYAAVRMIDNNSALNLSIASRRAGAAEGEPTVADLPDARGPGEPPARHARRARRADRRAERLAAGGVPIGTAVIRRRRPAAHRSRVRFRRRGAVDAARPRDSIARASTAAGPPFRAMPVSDALGLAYPFGVRAPRRRRPTSSRC